MRYGMRLVCRVPKRAFAIGRFSILTHDKNNLEKIKKSSHTFRHRHRHLARGPAATSILASPFLRADVLPCPSPLRGVAKPPRSATAGARVVMP